MHSKRKYCLLALQAIFVLSLGALSDKSIPFELTRPLVAGVIIWSVGVTFFVIRGFFHLPLEPRPLLRLVGQIKSEWRIFTRALEWALILGLALALHGWAKSMLPHVTSYWADPMLADADHFIFGRDPWQMFRSDLLGAVYSRAYVLWFPIAFGLMGLLAFSRRDHSVLLNASLASLILGGTIGQYILPSAGPIYFERVGLGARFAELVATNDPTFNALADYLWKFYAAGGAGLGTGISAMPSMHVTWAVWSVLAARAIWKPLAIPAVVYAGIIWAASIASGWHYALDGAVGVGIALGSYAFCKRMEVARGAVVAAQPLPSPAA